MSAPSNRHPQQRDERRDQLESWMIDELARPCPAPDLTARIMKRLGYRPADTGTARLGTIMLWGRRSGMALAALGVIAAGANLHHQSALVRRPSGPTVPAAIETGLEQGGEHINLLLRQIREFSVPRSAPASPGDSMELEDLSRPAVERSAIAPVQWV